MRIEIVSRKMPTGFAESLSGLIERGTFFNDDTGFGVIQVEAKGHRDLVTVVGSLPSANAKKEVTAEGRWVQDGELGRQFRAWLRTSRKLGVLLGQVRALGMAVMNHRTKNRFSGLPPRLQAPASMSSSELDTTPQIRSAGPRDLAYRAL